MRFLYVVGLVGITQARKFCTNEDYRKLDGGVFALELIAVCMETTGSDGLGECVSGYSAFIQLEPDCGLCINTFADTPKMIDDIMNCSAKCDAKDATKCQSCSIDLMAKLNDSCAPLLTAPKTISSY